MRRLVCAFIVLQTSEDRFSCVKADMYSMYLSSWHGSLLHTATHLIRTDKVARCLTYKACKTIEYAAQQNETLNYNTLLKNLCEVLRVMLIYITCISVLFRIAFIVSVKGVKIC